MPITTRIARHIGLLTALALTVLSPLVHAHDKPPLKILVGFPPGGSADVMARLVADALRDDFSPISQIARFQFGVVAGPASGVKNVGEMIAKANPGANSYGTPGAGTLPHFMGVLMEQSTGVQLNHVPFQGGAPANNA
ncbi:tripartite tricarboxylate transporter substrate binding protein [Limnohabitans sp. Jir72]|uniref:Bug family tripartite tricarboxylate transporter substrate binding protein n=1 Tax=Limnohabitans sp. Jir72 TaxID=1977909 RepID=UPI000D3892AC|nr:tripartite tricarboxylate transporter substrate-binding protein [Limnohabitans sp. Jir72]PUE34279.1 hypothetical protein B9Z52_05030 [Limnohabitans sp. Jir72]